MGQRHQLYIIARVIPHGSTDNKPYYRSIGGFHHQWFYGTLPLKGALRLIALLKNAVNAKIISAEIGNLHHKYSRTDTEGETAIPQVPCPYTHFLAATALTVDLDTSYLHECTFPSSALPAYYGCWDGDNNDGLTIIDVTNPSRPAYAFVMGPETDFGLGDTPVCAEDYVRAYYGVPQDESKLREEDIEEEKMIKQLISDFDDIPFLTEDLLAEAWPEEFGPNKRMPRRRKVKRKHIEPKVLATAEPVQQSEVGISSLADLTVAPAVSRSLERGDTTELELLLPAKAAQIRDALRGIDPFPDAGIALLSKVIDTSKAVDLSGFSLTPPQLASLASTFPESCRIEAVVLSESPKITIEHLRSLLETRADINRIELINTGITLKDMQAFFESSSHLLKRVSDVILLPGVFMSSVPHPGAFNLFAHEPSLVLTGNGQTEGIMPIAFWTPDKIVGNLVDLLQLFHKSDGNKPLKGVPTQACMGTGSRQSVTPTSLWGERSITIFPRYRDVETLSIDSWCFVLYKPSVYMSQRGGGPSGPKYAFAKLISQEPLKFDVFSFSNFLEEMKKEGRGPLPPDDVVKNMDDILAGKLPAKAAQKNDSETDFSGNFLSAIFGGLAGLAGPLIGGSGKSWSLFSAGELPRLFEPDAQQALTFGGLRFAM